MNVKRLLTHLFMTRWRVNAAFPGASLQAIEKAVHESHRMHAGQIRFAVEGALHSGALLKGLSARERAIDVFSELRVWDTEHNNGVLIYLLLADRDVEIIADRGIHARVGTEQWEAVCRMMESAFRRGDYAAGAIQGIDAISRHLTRHFPATGRAGENELPDTPLML
jgi:uncharacterized membrane protein